MKCKHTKLIKIFDKDNHEIFFICENCGHILLEKPTFNMDNVTKK